MIGQSLFKLLLAQVDMMRKIFIYNIIRDYIFRYTAYIHIPT